jgi:stearoyl-CoA desaturase (delta-9 desaturase)
MAPNLTTASALFLAEAEGSVVYQSKSQKPASVVRSRSAPQKENEEGDRPTKEYKWDISWRNVIAFIYLHVFALYGIYLSFTAAKYQTLVWGK